MGFDCAPIVMEAVKKLLKIDNGVIRHSVFKLQEHPLQDLRKRWHQDTLKQTLRKKREEAKKEEYNFVEKILSSKGQKF
jgi:ribosomal protein S6